VKKKVGGEATVSMHDPISIEEVTKIVAEQKSRPDHPVQECMPQAGVIHDYVAYARLAATNSCDIYHLGSIIPTLLNELNLRDFRVDGVGGDGQPKPLSCFSLLLGPSGDGKSTAATTAISHICSLLEAEDEANTQTAARARRLEFEGTAEGLRHALISRFYQRPLRSTVALLYHEELTALFARGSTHNAEFLQRLYDGRDIAEQQRQHQKTLKEQGVDNSTIHAPRVNAIFCSTPDNLSHVLTKTMASGGLYGRLLIFVGEKRDLLYEGDRLLNKDERIAASQRSEASLGEWSNFLEASSATLGRTVMIDREAHDVFKAWFLAHQKIINDTNAEDNLRSMVARATRTAWTIAGLYATTNFRMAIAPEDAEAACRLVDRCFHMGKVLDRRLGQSDESRLLDAMLAGIRSRGEKGATQSELHHMSGVANKGLTAFTIKQMVETLIESNDIVRVEEKRAGPGRRSSRYFTVEIAKQLQLQVESAAN
jgi:hypothetical protein